MKKMTFFGALLCTMLFSASALAEVKTYDFVVAGEGSIELPAWGAEVTSGGITLNMLATADGETFDNRFATGPTTRNNDAGNCFKFRTSGNWKGLWSQYGDRNISILNLKKGNKVTINISQEEQTLEFVSSGAIVVSGKEYIVEANGNLDFVSTGGVYIESITIDDSEDAAADIKAGYGTYNFVVAPEGSIVLPTWGEEVTSGDVTLNMLATADGETFDNRFATGPTTRNNDAGNCFKFRMAGAWKGLWSQYSDRNISILNLKQGDKVTFMISKEDQTLKFVDGDVVVSGQEYTAAADGNMDFVTTGSVYIESITITAGEGVATGIHAIRTTERTDNSVYNLNGQRVTAPTKGVFIVNGKKQLFK